MNRERARRICAAMKRTSAVVIGDIMLDRYVWGQVERISPEAPVPVIAVESTNARPGGAANVARNLVLLGCSVRLVGLIGRDRQAAEIKSIITESGVPTEHLVADRDRVTTEKTRIIAHSQQVVRADFESSIPVEGRVLSRLLAATTNAAAGADVIVVSDYGKGVVSEPVMDRLRSLAATRIPFLVDPKEGHFSLYRGAYVVTPNKKEAGGFYHTRIRTEEELVSIGTRLVRDLEARYVLITRGEEGMTLFGADAAPRHVAARASEVFDVTGAGDTVIGVLAAAVAARAAITEAIELANAAAGIVIRELGTAAVSREELVAAFR